MRGISVFLALMLHFGVLIGQTNPVDELFDRYAGKEGFTSVYISSKMLGLFANMDTGNEETGDLMGKLKSIRILSVEDSLLNRNINFHAELSKKMNFSDYEELMTVREGQDITFFLTKQSGKGVSELLMITGGPGGNTLISIRGDLSLKDISGLSESMGIEQLKQLEKADRKVP